MKSIIVPLLAAFFAVSCDAYVPHVKPSSTQKAFSIQSVAQDVSKTAMASFTALTIASNLLAPLPAQASEMYDFAGSSTIVSEKVIREGLYQDYEVDLEQTRDDARSTFKPAKETKSKKGKYTALLAVLIMGSFIIPMAQYFWYVKDDDSSDRFFEAQKAPEPEPPKKKGWFNKS